MKHRNTKAITKENNFFKCSVKNICNLALTTCFILTIIVGEVNADEINVSSITNNNGIIITTTEYDNLINLGFTNSEILNMTQQEYEENKDLTGSIVATNDKYYKVITKYDDYDNNVLTSYEEVSEYIYIITILYLMK